MGYKSKNEGEKILNEFPGLSAEDLAEVEYLYEPFLFYEKTNYGREIWTTCCHSHEHVHTLTELFTPADYELLRMQHGETVRCPFCGRFVTVKNHKLLRSGWKHKQYMPVLFLHVSEDGETVYAQGYWSMRDLKNDPAGQILYMVTYVYRFRRGEVMMWQRSNGSVAPCPIKGYRIYEPASRNGLYSGVEPYDVIGMNRLQNSFLKYTGYDVPVTAWERRHWEEGYLRGDLANYLAAAARWPENVEMLRKMGLDEPVIDVVYAGKKNADIMNWDETDPRKAFGLTKPQLKEWMASGGEMQTLRVWKGLHKTGSKVSFQEALAISGKLYPKTFREIASRARKHGINSDHLLKYLNAQTGPRCHGMGYFDLENAAQLWRDYIDAAAKIGYDLRNPIHQMPKHLDAKHNEATAAAQMLEVAEKVKEFKSRTAALDRRYGFEDNDFFIRAPINAEEIVAEGKALAHCVGGYAERHAKGTTTILFLRSKADPDKPYVTIEMDGCTIRQIHGYKNDLGAGRVSPMITHEKLLRNWRRWLKAGSKRDKNGHPVMTTKKKHKEDAA